MVATFKKERTSACGFAYLSPVSKAVAKPAATPAPKRSCRWLNRLLCAAYACAAVGAIALARMPMEEQAVVAQPAAKTGLFEAVGSPQYKAFAEAYEKEVVEKAIAEAGQKSEYADYLIAIATHDSADAVLSHTEGEPVKTTTLVQVTCDVGLGGQTATVRQVEGKYQDGIIRGLKTCNTGTLQPGDVIGLASAHSPSLEDLKALD